MFRLRMRAVARLILLMFVALGLLGTCGLAAQDASVTEITHHVLVFSTRPSSVNPQNCVGLTLASIGE